MRSLRRRDVLSRREFLSATGGAAAAVFLPSCGGDNTLVPQAPAEPVVLASTPRTTPTGSLTNQVQQYSVSADALAHTWTGQTPHFDALKSFLTGQGANPDSSMPPTTRGRAADDFQAAYQAHLYTLPMLKESYERLCNGALGLDDLGALGDTVSGQNGLTGSASLANPFWTAGMMETHYHLLRTVGGLCQFFQTVGFMPLIQLVHNQTAPDQKLLAYFLAADTYNSWVDAVSADLMQTADPAWKLDISSSITAANADQQIDTIPTLTARVPLGIGYRTTTVTRGQGSLPDNIGSFFGSSGLGAFTKNYLGSGQAADPVKILARIGMDPRGVISNVLGGNGPGLRNIQQAIANLIASEAELLFGKQAGCLIQIAAGAFNVAEYAAAALGSAESVVGALVFGALGLMQACSLVKTVTDCLMALGMTPNQATQDLLDALNALCLNPPPQGNRNVPARPITGIEGDQVRAQSLSRSMVTPPNGDYMNMGQDFGRRLLCGALTGSTSPSGTRVFRGRQTAGSLPRTYTNASSAALSLLYDLSQRNAQFLQPDSTATSFSFYRSTTAFLLRRDPGVTLVSVPAITSADLLCTAPAFIPSRSAVDLSMLPEFDSLQPIGPLGTGVIVNAS